MERMILRYVLGILSLLTVSSVTHAGHLFTQASSNTPTWIQSGQGIVIKQYGDEGGSGSGNIDINFAANSTPPDDADTSNSNWWQWSAGDVMRITLPLTDNTYTYTIAYDAAGSGGCDYDFCGQTGSSSLNVSGTDLGGSGVTLPDHSGEESSYDESDVYFSWSIEALAGEFSLSGYRIRTSDGTIDGTGAGILDQDSVVDADEVANNVGGSVPDIDNAKTEYTPDELNNNQVNPKFTGGTLTIGSGTDSITANFSVDANGGTIQTNGDTEIAGVISDDSGNVGSSGSLTKTGDSELTLSGINTFAGDIIVEAGTLAAEGSLAGGVVVNNNGTLKGSGVVTGITSNGIIAPGDSPGTLTSAGNVVMNSGSTLQEEIDGSNYNPAGGAGSYDRVAVTGAGNTFTADGTLEILLRGITAPANNDFTPVLGDSFRIVTTEESNGVNGSFVTVNQPASGLSDNTRFDLQYGNNYIDLVVTPGSYAVYAAQNGNLNARNAMTALEAIRPAAGVRPSGSDPFSGLMGLSGTVLNTSIAQLSGEIHAQSANDVKDQMILLSDLLVTSAYELDPDEMLWANVSSNQIEYRQDKISSGYDSSARSLVVGYDFKREEDKRYGLALSYSDSKLSAKYASSSENTLATMLAYYEGTKEAEKLEVFQLNLNLGLGVSEREIERSVSLASGINTHKSSVQESVLFGQARISHLLKDGEHADITGYSSLRFQALKGDAYQEKGSAATMLSIDSGSQTSAQLGVGVLINFIDTNKVDWSLDMGLFTELVRDHETLDRDLSLGAARWEVEGTDVGSISAKVAAHGSWKFSENMSGFAALGVSGSSNRIGGYGSLGIRIDLK
ncbi:autotransporter domain-containing protein [Endozoicomonas arenosclerae]|uniref:autotransporter family protein n=1 Tax=Endozoicomonas arenosclerae TaxID=1633495 RepID=UPI0007822C58|nr:autotransporter domain-containing protein [Endozoicomonas arenosclerae]